MGSSSGDKYRELSRSFVRASFPRALQTPNLEEESMATGDVLNNNTTNMRSNYPYMSVPLYDRPSLAQNLRRKSTMIARKYLQTPDRPPRPSSYVSTPYDLESHMYENDFDVLTLNDPEPDSYTNHIIDTKPNYMRKPFIRTTEEPLPPPVRAESRLRALEKQKFSNYLTSVQRKYDSSNLHQRMFHDDCTNIRPSQRSYVETPYVDPSRAYVDAEEIDACRSRSNLLSSKETPRLPVPDYAPCRFLKPLTPVPSAPPERYRMSSSSASSATCTAKELSHIITEPSGGEYVIPFEPWSEVYPGVYVGDMATALCVQGLKIMGITHVLNAAQKDARPGAQAPGYYVNTNAAYYKWADIRFLGIPATDVIEYDLSPYFEEAADFIDSALNCNGKVLVHCHQGISRSATLVLAFLMLRKGMSAQEAMKTVRAKREVIPNPSFLRQLCDLNDRLTTRMNVRKSRYPRYT